MSLFPKCNRCLENMSALLLLECVLLLDRCIEDMSALHTVDADPKKVEDLENRDVDPKVAVFALQRSNNDLDEAYQIHSIFRMEVSFF